MILIDFIKEFKSKNYYIDFYPRNEFEFLGLEARITSHHIRQIKQPFRDELDYHNFKNLIILEFGDWKREYYYNHFFIKNNENDHIIFIGGYYSNNLLMFELQDLKEDDSYLVLKYGKFLIKEIE